MSETSKGIYVVNTCDFLEKNDYLLAGTVSADLTSEIIRAFRAHAFKGKAPFIALNGNDRSMLSSDGKSAYQIAVDSNMHPVWICTTPELNKFDVIRDWAAELEIHSPKIHAAILRKKVSFAAMIEHAVRWHEAKARKADKLRDRGIERDDLGAPTVLECDGGWRWVWLKSDEARDEEGRVMGHCVGDGGYDIEEGSDCGVFSLRDPQNRPHVTVELRGTELEQAQCRGNTQPPDHYKPLIEELRAVVGLRLAMSGDPATPIADGVHHANSAKYHVADGRLHREGGPARVTGFWGEYFEDGIQTRGTVSIISRLREEEWYDAEGRLHRDGGPARVAYKHHPESEAPEWWQHGDRKEEDGSPWVEPQHFEKGHTFLDADSVPHIVLSGHTAKTPEYAVPALHLFDDVDKAPWKIGCTDRRFVDGVLRGFTVRSNRAEYEFKDDGAGGISLSVTQLDPGYYVGGGFIQHTGREVVSSPLRTMLPTMRQREDYLDYSLWRGREFFFRNEPTPADLTVNDDAIELLQLAADETFRRAAS